MPASHRISVGEPDVFAVLSAIWVLASNDENPLMTYEGVRRRLRLSSDFDLRALVDDRGELFRKGVPIMRLERWKSQMLAGRHIPSWIRELEDQEFQKSAIQNLTVDDVFRSQFRARADSPRSEIEIIDWGLQHIDRLRKANMEASEKTARSWQIWLVFGVGVLNVVVVVITAVLR